MLQLARTTHLAVQKSNAIHDTALSLVAWKCTESGASCKFMTRFSRTPVTKWIPEEKHSSTASSPKGSTQQAPYAPFKCSTQTFSQWNIVSNSSLMKSKINYFLLDQNRDEKYEFDKILKNIQIIIRILPFLTVFVLRIIFEKLRQEILTSYSLRTQCDSFQGQIKLNY